MGTGFRLGGGGTKNFLRGYVPPPSGRTLIISSANFEIYGSARNSNFCGKKKLDFFVLILVSYGI